MASLGKAAILHESTVQKADDVRVTNPRRGRGKAKPKLDSPVESIKVNPLVWEQVLALAGGDPRRIVIVSETECFIRNGDKVIDDDGDDDLGVYYEGCDG